MAVGYLLENIQKFILVDLTIAVLVNIIDEGLDFGFGGISVGVHVFEGSIDKGGHFSWVQGSAVVVVEMIEDLVNGLFELGIGV